MVVVAVVVVFFNDDDDDADWRKWDFDGMQVNFSMWNENYCHLCCAESIHYYFNLA